MRSLRPIAGIAALALLLSCIVGSVASADTPTDAISLVVNGEAVVTDVPPQNINGRVMVPVRFASQALGATANWDGATSTVVIESASFSGTSDPLAVGADKLPGMKIMVDGELVTCDVPPCNVDGRVLVPVRFVSEALGAKVEWVPEDNSVVITSAPEGFVRCVSTTYGVTLLHPETWEARTAPSGGVRVEREGQGLALVEVGSFGDDPFFPPRSLCEAVGDGYAVEMDATVEEVPVDETPALESAVAEAYAKYRVTSDAGVVLVECWAFHARGGLRGFELVYSADPAGTGPADQEAWAEGKAILDSVKVISDSHRFETVYEYPEWDLTFSLPGVWIKYLELPGAMVAFKHGADMSLAVTVGQVQPGTTTAGFLDQFKATVQDMYGSFLTLGGTSPASLAGGEALVLDYTLVIAGVPVHGEEYVLVSGGRFLAVTFSSDQSHKDDPTVRAALRDVLDAMVWGTSL
jgi:hypothetical protein